MNGLTQAAERDTQERTTTPPPGWYQAAPGSLEERAARTRRLLQDQGAVYASLTAYLSSRIDLLPAVYCREFENSSDSLTPLSAAQVETILAEDLGSKLLGLFAEFDLAPRRLGLIGQEHWATLASGEPVAVFVVRPNYASTPHAREITASLRHPSMRDDCSIFAKEEVIADFLNGLQRATDLQLRRQVMQSPAAQTGLLEANRGPRIYSELSGARVLTASRNDETFLHHLSRSPRLDRAALARRLCETWLHEALCGQFCAVDPRLDNISLSGTNSIRFRGDEFVVLPRGARENLEHYLLATLTDDPDKAAFHLLQEMISAKSFVSEIDEFRSNFRQAAYFGALEPVLGTNTNALIQLIFQHWKTALGHGYTPTADLLCFYRGLFSVARLVRRLAPEEDPLREGLEEFHASRVACQFEEMASLSHWSHNADKLATVLINFPRALDDALSRATASTQNRWLARLPRPSFRYRALLSWASLLITAAVFIVLPDAEGWIERSAALALMLAGLWGPLARNE